MDLKYDIIHFEALGEEAKHLEEETEKAKEKGTLPKEHTYLITPDNLQDFLAKNLDVSLPEIISTKTHSKIPDWYLEGSKKSIITRSAGYDHFEHLASAANVASLREYCVNAVAQTAIKFLYATAGVLNHYTLNTVTFERKNAQSFMELGTSRVATVFGVGKIGKKIYDLLEGNGLKVQAVDIREEELRVQYNNTVNFVTRDIAINNSDIIINAMNLTRLEESKFYNVNYFSKETLQNAKAGLIFVNVTRGEIAPESVLLDLYDKGIISGLGLDVFSNEAIFSNALNGKSSFDGDDVQAAKILLERSINRSANIYVQPHQGFNSDLAAATKAEDAIHHVEAWWNNKKLQFDEQLPYYSNI